MHLLQETACDITFIKYLICNAVPLFYIKIYIYIYIYIYCQYIFIDTYLIEYNRYFSTYLFVNPFELPY